MKLEALNLVTSESARAEKELREFFERLDTAVTELDEETLLLPGDINPEDRYIVWSLVSEAETEEEEEEEEEEEDYEDREDEEVEEGWGEDEEEWEDDEEEEDDEEDEEEEDGEEERRIRHEVGVFIWSPEEGEAAASVYVVVDGGNRAKRWREVKDLAQTFEGRIHLHHPDWTPDEVEIRRFDLKKDLDPYEIARVVVKVAEEL